MHDLGLLRDLIAVFGVSVIVVLLLHRLKLPTITGFLISGMLLGPHGLSLVSDIGRIEVLAEIGVILLLFTVGMEFSIATLRRVWATSFLGALLPIAAWAALGASVSSLLKISAGQGVFLGFLVALSSTVIPLKALSDSGQVDSPHGRAAIGVAVFQDLLVVPMMLLVPFLASYSRPGGISGPASPSGLTMALVQAVGVIAAVLVVAFWGVPKVLASLTALKSREVFIISVFLICLGTAWITSSVGLSLALGAFLAGLVISESEYGHQALADVLPLRDSLTSLFFVSVGMLMDPGLSLNIWMLILAGALGIMALKPLAIATVLFLVGHRPTVALQTGVALAQVGEFSFVLMGFGSAHGLMSDTAGQIFLGSAVLSMIATPLILVTCPPLVGQVRRWEERGWWRPPADLRPPEDPGEEMTGHVIIVGYGFNGRNLGRVLKEIGIPYVVLEMNPQTVRRARAAGETIVFGDASSSGILHRLGAERARVLVVAISDPVSTRRAVSMARNQFPGLHIVVRSRYLGDVGDLYKIGADLVIPEEVETSMEIFSRVLEHFGIPREVLVKHARRIRAERYGLFRAGRSDPAASRMINLADLKPYLASMEVQICSITEQSRAIGRSLSDLDLRRLTGASVIALVRDGKIVGNPAPDSRLVAGDSVVLVGGPEQIGAAADTLAGTGG